jgi:ABC-type multidrug transport system fused ATPase/permease subunit
LEKDPHDWPAKGRVEFLDYGASYASSAEQTVRAMTLDIAAGEKIGIVGRTGSGKSTLVSSLFRMMHQSTGSILIDAIDITTIGIATLRSAIHFLPQQPILFQGTIRSNLDPHSNYTDQELWEAISLCNLSSFIRQLPEKLDNPVEYQGQNISLGQRQLLCIAVAVLKKPKIVIFDESTSAMDLETDQQIQTLIKTVFKDSTVLTIAHRLQTIAGYDRVIVMDQGQMVCCDKPESMLLNPNSAFYKLAMSSGESTYKKLLEIARNK